MSITEADELQHPPGEDLLWRESFYFNFHDASGKIGGMATIGVLPNQNRAEGFAIIFLSDRVLFCHTEGLPRVGNAGLFSVPGITCNMLSPLQKLCFRVAAPFSNVDPHGIIGKASLPETTIPAGFDLTFTALGPAYEFSAPAFELLKVAARHFEQTGRVEGKVYVSGQRFTVSGLGCRDRSWGVRDLSKADGWVVAFAQLDPNFTVNAIWAMVEEQKIAMGYVFRDGMNTAIDDIHLTLEIDQRSNFPKAVQTEINTVDGQRFALQAEITSVMPIVLPHKEGRLLWYECSTCFRHGQQTGYGIVEMSRLIR